MSLRGSQPGLLQGWTLRILGTVNVSGPLRVFPVVLVFTKLSSISGFLL